MSFVGKAHRIRQAREEAQADIEKYRNEREKVFKEFEAMRLGSREGIALRIDEDTEMHIEKMQQDVANNKEQVLHINILTEKQDNQEKVF